MGMVFHDGKEKSGTGDSGACDEELPWRHIPTGPPSPASTGSVSQKPVGFQGLPKSRTQDGQLGRSRGWQSPVCPQSWCWVCW